MHCVLSESESPALPLPERGKENIEYLISSSGNRTHNLSRLHLHACVIEPQVASNKTALNNQKVKNQTKNMHIFRNKYLFSF